MKLVDLKDEDKEWLNGILKGMVKNPESVCLGIQSGRCDLEIIIQVESADRAIFTEEVLHSLKQQVASRTGVLSPVIYLDGNEPEWLAKGHNIS
jgi:hypothetical protein